MSAERDSARHGTVTGVSDGQGFRITVPPELEAGVYSNAMSVWHTKYEFTLDFLSLGQPSTGEDADVARAAPVVARIKVPTQVIFQLARAIADNVDRYEQQYGSIDG